MSSAPKHWKRLFTTKVSKRSLPLLPRPMAPDRITVSCRPRATGRQFGKFAIDAMSCSLPMRSCLGLRERASGLRWNTLASLDIMTLAKGISSCCCPRRRCYFSVPESALRGRTCALYSRVTNGGHPLACAAGIELLEIIKDEQLLENCRNKKRFCSPIRNHC